MNILRLTGFAPVSNKLLFGLYWLSFGGFIFLNNILNFINTGLHFHKFRIFLYVLGVYCRGSVPADPDKMLFTSATFIGLKLLVIPVGWLLYKWLKQEQLKTLLFEVLVCYFLFEIVFLIWYPVLQLFDIDLTWYYFSEFREFYIGFLLGMPDFTVPAILSFLFGSYLLYFKPFPFREIAIRVLFCSFSLAFFIALFESLKYLFF